jgi:ATP-dependent helicase/nuclease subunit A
MSLTTAQSGAITARGNVLVVAGAGSGKTHTLVERCLHRVLDEQEPASLDRILMVTFTEAAAAEMKSRIRDRLNAELERAAGDTPSGSPPSPRAHRLAEQVALLDTAHIGTLHAFCFHLLRQHFHELKLDPQLTVLRDEQAHVLMEETLDELLGPHFAGDDAFAAAVQELITAQSGSDERPIRELLVKLHNYTQTLPDPAKWFEEQLGQLAREEPACWRRWLVEGVIEWRNLWVPLLRAQPEDNTVARRCAKVLEDLPEASPQDWIAGALNEVIAAENGPWPPKQTTRFKEPIKALFPEAAFLRSLFRSDSGTDPLAEDWACVRGQMTTLLRLAREFSHRFAAAKRDLGVVDFHDLEQFALTLLWDRAGGRPTALAEQWRQKLDLVFVDECQDINAAQDAILRALGREGEQANRFLVGDVKQSIYRFRLADPGIFQAYKKAWQKGGGHQRVIPLSDNFRSREALLRCVNEFFRGRMRAEVGGVDYDPEAELRFGDPEQRAALAAKNGDAPRVEVHLRLTDKRQRGHRDPEAEDGDMEADPTETEAEARLIALRLKHLLEERHQVWDKNTAPRGGFRAVRWSDMAVLLRSPTGRVEVFAREFARVGVPLQTVGGGFYESSEISDLHSLLQLLDNPLQDIPLLAVLRSPLVGMSLDELADIRLAGRRGSLWAALQRWHETNTAAKAPAAWPKVDTFLARFRRWRRMAREVSLSQRLETVLDETLYFEWLASQPRGEQRQANVRRLLALAQEFDPLRRQGLQRFLRFVQAQREAGAEIEPAAPGARDAVQLTSIHRSKGLEYAVVAVAGLGKRFNFDDLNGRLVLDELYGPCPHVQPPGAGGRYPSLPLWLARRRQKREALGEEMRLLYVAMTRARDTLLLVGTASAKKAREQWPETDGAPTTAAVLAANSYLDWLGPWWTHASGDRDWAKKIAGVAPHFTWRVYEGEIAADAGSAAAPAPPPTGLFLREPGPEELAELHRRLAWSYRHRAATREAAKTSVSALRRRAVEAEEEAKPWLQARATFAVPRGESGLSGAELGTAHHQLLQRLQLDRVNSLAELAAQAEELTAGGFLTAAERAALDLEAVLAFWQSEPGRALRDHAAELHRELPFTARFDPAALGIAAEDLGDEFVVVQGVVDLARIGREEIWLVDFKTDAVKGDDLDAKVAAYRPQLDLYARALAAIYRRPVTRRWLHFLRAGRTVTIPPAMTGKR